MTQEQVIEYLKKQKEPKSRGEIAEAISKTPDVVGKTVRQLLKYKEIQCIEINRLQAMQKFNRRGRMRLYYL